MFQLDTPRMPELDTSRCYAKIINYETAANMVEHFHYAHRVPPITLAVGMYVDDVLAGCITYGTPASTKARWAVCGKEHQDYVLELNRLYIHDWAGRNSESWLIGQSFRFLGKPRILVSYADTGQSHLGRIYQATNWLYTGLSDPSGCFSRIEIKGKEMTSKNFYDALGTQAKSVILEYYPDAIFHEYTRKHRYVYFLANKWDRKQFRSALRWSIVPYPKD